MFFGLMEVDRGIYSGAWLGSDIVIPFYSILRRTNKLENQ